MADSVNSQLSPEAVGRKMPLFLGSAFGEYGQSPLPAKSGIRKNPLRAAIRHFVESIVIATANEASELGGS